MRLLAELGEVVAAEIAALGFEGRVEEPDAAFSDEDRLHAVTANAASESTPGNLVIGSKDRCDAQAPRLLFLR